MANVNVSPELAEALRKLLVRAWRIRIYPRLYSRRSFDYRVGRKYILILPGPFDNLFVLPDGELYRARFRGSWMPNFGQPLGNLHRLVGLKGWEKCVTRSPHHRELIIRIPGTPKLECEVCHRDHPADYVVRTAVGLRCRFCRSGDGARMTTLRQLGVMPRVGSRILTTNEDYYRP